MGRRRRLQLLFVFLLLLSSAIHDVCASGNRWLDNEQTSERVLTSSATGDGIVDAGDDVYAAPTAEHATATNVDVLLVDADAGDAISDQVDDELSDDEARSLGKRQSIRARATTDVKRARGAASKTKGKASKTKHMPAASTHTHSKAAAAGTHKPTAKKPAAKPAAKKAAATAKLKVLAHKAAMAPPKVRDTGAIIAPAKHVRAGAADSRRPHAPAAQHAASAHHGRAAPSPSTRPSHRTMHPAARASARPHHSAAAAANGAPPPSARAPRAPKAPPLSLPSHVTPFGRCVLSGDFRLMFGSAQCHRAWQQHINTARIVAVKGADNTGGKRGAFRVALAGGGEAFFKACEGRAYALCDIQ